MCCNAAVKLKPIGSLVDVLAISESHGEPRITASCCKSYTPRSNEERIINMVATTKATTPTSAVTKRKPVTKKLTAPTKKASVLAREAQAAKKRLLKLRADTKKAIEAAKREVVKATEAAKSAARLRSKLQRTSSRRKSRRLQGSRRLPAKLPSRKSPRKRLPVAKPMRLLCRRRQR